MNGRNYAVQFVRKCISLSSGGPGSSNNSVHTKSAELKNSYYRKLSDLLFRRTPPPPPRRKLLPSRIQSQLILFQFCSKESKCLLKNETILTILEMMMMYHQWLRLSRKRNGKQSLNFWKRKWKGLRRASKLGVQKIQITHLSTKRPVMTTIIIAPKMRKTLQMFRLSKRTMFTDRGSWGQLWLKKKLKTLRTDRRLKSLPPSFVKQMIVLIDLLYHDYKKRGTPVSIHWKAKQLKFTRR